MCRNVYRCLCLGWLLGSLPLNAQTITHGDGSPLQTRYCYADNYYSLSGTPAGGSFSGCGISQQGGQWYFNPVHAAQSTTVFPYQCTLTYTVNHEAVSQHMLVYKPVRIEPPLQDTATCNGHFLLEAKTLYAGAYHYRWSPAAPLERADTSYTPGYTESTQSFVLEAEDVTSGCTGSDSMRVTRNPVPEVRASPDSIVIRAREAVHLQAGGAAYYYWLPPRWLSNDTIADPVALPQAPVTYTVVGTNEYGCSDTATVHIDIKERMMVPNAFSPNGDGVNDLFKVENIGYQGVEIFRIFNRWGQLVYETLDGTRGWDGTYRGKPAAAGTYYYLIRLGQRDGTPRIYKGSVQLLR